MNIDIVKIKLASIAVHVEEAYSPSGHEVDRHAISSLLADPDVRGFLDDPKNAVFLPVKRQATR